MAKSCQGLCLHTTSVFYNAARHKKKKKKACYIKETEVEMCLCCFKLDKILIT